VASGRAWALPAQGIPFGLFVAACVATFLSSRDRPGDNPVAWVAERAADGIALVRRAAAAHGPPASAIP